jgi:hypothetical protein
MKIHNPIYLPLTTTQQMLLMSEGELKSLIEGGLKQTYKGFTFNPTHKVLDQ